jgi:predicted phage terminase large subunit-like protein
MQPTHLQLKIDRNEVIKELARKSHEHFMMYCWQRPDPFVSGIHIKEICARIDKAIEDFKKGISTYLAIKLPFRHAKSEILSRYLPPHWIGQFPDTEVILTAYNAGLAQGFSRNARSILKSDKFGELYPGIEVSEESGAVGSWGIKGHMGQTNWCGIQSGATGKGASLLLIDDFFSGREQAESLQIREKVWETFSDDLLSRLAPTHVVIILATDWHVDSLFGRISKNMEESSTFPRFETIRFAAQNPLYPGGWLWLERYPESWYVAQKGSRSVYSFNSIMQNSPTVRGSTMLRTDKIQYIKSLPDNLRWVRAWDLSSSEEDQNKSDPDYTVGALVAVEQIGSEIPGVKTPVIYVKDIIRGRWEASTRNKIIRDTALAEPNIRIAIEDFGAYKDAFTILRDNLMGLRHVEGCKLPGSKLAKFEALVSPFEAGNVYLPRLPDVDGIPQYPKWHDDFVDELDVVPNGAHDDQADALCVGFAVAQTLSTELVHTNQHIISDHLWDDLKDPEVYNGLFVDEKWCYIVTANWDIKGRRLHIRNEISLDTIEYIAAYIKVSKSRHNIAPSDLDTPSAKSVQTELTNLKVWVSTDETFDPLGCLFFLNSLIDNRRLTISSKCRNLLLSMQNDTEVKNIGPYLHALLYIINNLIIRTKDPREERELKAFSKEKTDYQKSMDEQLSSGYRPNKNKPGWYDR